MKERFDLINYDFGDQLIVSVIQTYGLEVFHRACIDALGDKTEKDGIIICKNYGDGKNLLEKFHDLYPTRFQYLW